MRGLLLQLLAARYWYELPNWRASPLPKARACCNDWAAYQVIAYANCHGFEMGRQNSGLLAAQAAGCSSRLARRQGSGHCLAVDGVQPLKLVVHR